LGEEVGRVGLVRVEGMVSREVAFGERHKFELLGPGDVVRVPESGARGDWVGLRFAAARGTVVVGMGESLFQRRGAVPA
jgi:hypothetical protein